MQKCLAPQGISDGKAPYQYDGWIKKGQDVTYSSETT